ncbi:MAG TPA: tripartite tricarboxylate transporter TctB family protein [Nitrospiraceae bacterium]|nr:tripartite tricarboxylate transporter TctB family protein [Nitrospiraceae bacterium]
MSRDLSSALFWLAIAIFISFEGFTHLKLGTLRAPGPGFFPFWGGVVLGVLSLVLLLNSLKNRGTLSLSSLKSLKLLLVTGAILAYLLLLETLGFVTITFLFLFLLFRMEYRGWVFSAVIALVGAVSSYVLFQLWLKTQLPAGPFGF